MGIISFFYNFLLPMLITVGNWMVFQWEAKYSPVGMGSNMESKTND